MVLVPEITAAIDQPGIDKTAGTTGTGEMTAFATSAMSARFPRVTRSSTAETASPKHSKASAKSSAVMIAEGVRNDDRIRRIEALAAERAIPVDRVPRQLLDELTPGNHQGVLIESGPFVYADPTAILGTSRGRC
ncbi:MAG: RNA methyltransferase substrate-binding domain-containing protein [Thermomicrobiales bacterium]